jgi:Phosphotransferase enzyme family
MSNSAGPGEVRQQPPFELSPATIDEYVEITVLPNLPAGTTITRPPYEVGDGQVNWVFALECSTGKVFIRQSREYMRSYPSEPRSRDRTDTEARTLRYLGELIPGRVPDLILFDQPKRILVLRDIQRGGRLFSDELASGNAQPEAGGIFGSILASIQADTIGKTLPEVLGEGVSSPESTGMLSYLGKRTDLARMLAPELTDSLLAESDGENTPRTLILGDYVPKNMFIRPESFLDLERVTIGDPAYDPAYLLSNVLIEGEIIGDQTLQFTEKFMTTYLSEISKIFSQTQLNGLQNRILRYMGLSILQRTNVGGLLVSYEGPNQELWRQTGLHLMGCGSQSVMQQLSYMSLK